MKRARPLALLALFLSFPVSADVPPGQRAEVEHLLSFVTRSDCRFERNGAAHAGAEAAAHMRRKYDQVRDRIRSTEEFIERAASRSTMTGRRRPTGARDTRLAAR